MVMRMLLLNQSTVITKIPQSNFRNAYAAQKKSMFFTAIYFLIRVSVYAAGKKFWSCMQWFGCFPCQTPCCLLHSQLINHCKKILNEQRLTLVVCQEKYI
jgi:hypothetical protein